MSDESRKQFEEEWMNSMGADAGRTDIEGIKMACWYFWQRSRTALVVELPVIFGAGRTLNTLRVAIKECAETLKEAGITVKGEGDGKTNVPPPQ